MTILLTGAGGFLGGKLLPRLLEQDNTVYGLYRKPPVAHIPLRLIPLIGDITKPNLGLEDAPRVDLVIHCAALLSFSSRDKDRLYETNCQGTRNLLEWMRNNRIARLFHVSTAYLFRHNHYEISKEMAEEAIGQYPEIRTTIFRPSIIIGDSRLQGLPPLSGFYAGIKVIDRAKRWFEQKTGAWPLRVRIRIQGRRSGKLNLIPVDVVVQNMVDIVNQDRTGIFYLTHPQPPTFKSLEKPISEAIGANIKVASKFKPNLAERMVALSLRQFTAYLQGNNLPSDIECPRLSEEFLAQSISSIVDQPPVKV